MVIKSAAGTILVLGNVSDPMGGILLKNSLRRGHQYHGFRDHHQQRSGATIALEGNQVVVNNVPLNPPRTARSNSYV